MKSKSDFLSLVTGILLLSFATLSAQSSERYKDDIHDMAEASTNLMRLRPVTFRYKEAYDAGDGELRYGLIAEEVAEVFPDLVGYNEDGEPETIKYHLLATLMLSELQKQVKAIEVLKAEVREVELLKSQVADFLDLNTRLARLEALEAQRLMAVADSGSIQTARVKVN